MQHLAIVRYSEGILNKDFGEIQNWPQNKHHARCFILGFFILKQQLKTMLKNFIKNNRKKRLADFFSKKLVVNVRYVASLQEPQKLDIKAFFIEALTDEMINTIDYWRERSASTELERMNYNRDMDLMKEKCKEYEKTWKRIIANECFGKDFKKLSFFDKVKILFDV